MYWDSSSSAGITGTRAPILRPENPSPSPDLLHQNDRGLLVPSMPRSPTVPNLMAQINAEASSTQAPAPDQAPAAAAAAAAAVSESPTQRGDLEQSMEEEEVSNAVLCMACTQDDDSSSSSTNSDDSIAHIFMMNGTPTIDDVSPTPLDDVKMFDTDPDMIDALQALIDSPPRTPDPPPKDDDSAPSFAALAAIDDAQRKASYRHWKH